MTLPASQYSVLDAKRIERIDDDTFRCYVGGISLLNFKVCFLLGCLSVDASMYAPCMLSGTSRLVPHVQPSDSQ